MPYMVPPPVKSKLPLLEFANAPYVVGLGVGSTKVPQPVTSAQAEIFAGAAQSLPSKDPPGSAWPS